MVGGQQRAGDQRRETGAEQCRGLVAERGAGVAHPGGEHLAEQGAERPVHHGLGDAVPDHAGEDQQPGPVAVHEREDREGGGRREQRPGQHDGTPPEPVREMVRARQHHEGHAGGDGDADEHLLAAVPLVDGVRDQEAGHQRLRGERTDADRRGEQHRPRRAQHVEQRRARPLPPLRQRGEERTLGDLQAYVETGAEQHEREQERHPPAPGAEVVVRQHADQRDDPGGEHRAQRGAELGEAGPQAARPVTGVFGDHERRAAPFAADRDALYDAEQDEQDGGPDADRVVRGQQADEEAAGAHQDHRQEHHRLAAEPVAEVAEDDAAERTGEIPRGERAEGGHGAHRRVGPGEEEVAEDERGDGSVDEEVVELHGCAEQPGQRDAAQLPGRGPGFPGSGPGERRLARWVGHGGLLTRRSGTGSAGRTRACRRPRSRPCRPRRSAPRPAPRRRRRAWRAAVSGSRPSRGRENAPCPGRS